MRSLALVVVVLATAVMARHHESRPTYTAKDEQLAHLPDHTDPHINHQLRCSACKNLADHIFERLSKLHKLRHGKPRSYEVVEALENICGELRDQYGLLLRNNMPTNEFSRDESITRMKGAWINTFIEGRCGDILSHYEESIMEHFGGYSKAEQLQQLICYRLERSCVAVEYTHEEL